MRVIDKPIVTGERVTWNGKSGVIVERTETGGGARQYLIDVDKICDKTLKKPRRYSPYGGVIERANPKAKRES